MALTVVVGLSFLKGRSEIAAVEIDSFSTAVVVPEPWAVSDPCEDEDLRFIYDFDLELYPCGLEAGDAYCVKEDVEVRLRGVGGLATDLPVPFHYQPTQQHAEITADT